MTMNGVEINPCYPKVTCTACGGTGRIAVRDRERRPVETSVPQGDAPPGLAGRWQANDGSEYEFTGSGRDYKMRSRTPMGDLTGHAVVEGRRGRMTMKIPMLGQFESAIQIASDHKSMIVTTKVMGVSAPVRFDRVSWPRTAAPPPPPPPPDDDPEVAAAMEEADRALKARDYDRAEDALIKALEAAGKTPSPEDDLKAMIQLMAVSFLGTRLSDRAVNAYLGAVEMLATGEAAARLVPHVMLLGTLVPAYGLGAALDARLARAGHAILGKHLTADQALTVGLVTADAQHRSGDSDGATRLLADAKRAHREGTSMVRIAQVEASILFDRQQFAAAFDALANAIRAATPDTDAATLASSVIQLLWMWPRGHGGLEAWLATLCDIVDQIDEPKRSKVLVDAIELLLSTDRRAEARTLAPHCNFDLVVDDAPPALAERVAAGIAEIQQALA